LTTLEVCPSPKISLITSFIADLYSCEVNAV
jgi:hypothetical protein